MKPNFYTVTGQQPDDAINKVKTFINELQMVQEKYYAELLKDLNLRDESIDDWLFDYIFNEGAEIDETFTEYLKDKDKNYEDFAKNN